MRRLVNGFVLWIFSCLMVAGIVGHFQSPVAFAQRTLNGKYLTTKNGSMVCDCTNTTTPECYCVVP